MEDREFSVLHSSLASESPLAECLEAVITQQQGRNRKDFIISFRMSREVLRSQVLWLPGSVGYPVPGYSMDRAGVFRASNSNVMIERKPFVKH